jgi:transposase
MRHHFPPRTTPPRRWQPLSDAEWAALAPFLPAATGPGRPLPEGGLRTRLDGIFWVAAAGCPWDGLPPRHGSADTVSRHFRRLTHTGLWETLLYALAHPACPAPLRALEHWVCRAARRATRLRGLRLIVLARRVGLLSALRAPPRLLPDPDLSETVQRAVESIFKKIEAGSNTPALRQGLRLCGRLLRLAGGRRRIPRCLEPA